MALSVTHTFVSAISDDGAAAAAGEVLPSHWNASHTLTGTASIAQGGTNASSFTSGQSVYFDGTKLAGDVGLTYTAPGQLTAALGTITANAKAINITGTWNAAGVTFDAPLFMNITDTASAAGSTLIDIQVGGTPLLLLQPKTNAILSLAKGNTASAFRVYNTADTLSGPTNYERAVIDWITTANKLTIATQAGGTGTGRDINITPASNLLNFVGTGGNETFRVGGAVEFTGSNNGIQKIGASSVFGFTDANNVPGNTPDTGVSRATAPGSGVGGVVAIGNGTVQDHSGFIQWGGQARVTADFSVTSSTTLANVTGLGVTLKAGRTYMFEAELYVTDAAAGGVQAAIAGTATATAIQYTGFTIADNAIKGKTNATALGTAVGSTTTTETSGIVVRISGTITVNAAGTLTVQMAQNTSNGTATVAKRGSYFLVHDMP